jgi:hypothetical protein
MGGALAVYRREAAGEWRLAGEDSGYLLRHAAGGPCWLTRVPGAGDDGGRLAVKARFHLSLHDELTPLRMVALRVLNLTVLRVQWLGDLFRKVVVARLMGGRETLPLALSREIVFSGDGVTVRDRVAADGSLGAAAGTALYRCRRVTGIHMASARYFQAQELEDAAGPWMARVSDDVAGGYSHTSHIDAILR